MQTCNVLYQDLTTKGRHTHKSPRLVPATSPLKSLHERDWLQGVVPQTVHTKHSEEQIAGTCPKKSNWFEFLGQGAGTRFWIKNCQSTWWDLSPQLVAGTTCTSSYVPNLNGVISTNLVGGLKSLCFLAQPYQEHKAKESQELPRPLALLYMIL